MTKFYIEYRHCKFPVRSNQRDKWNRWVRYSRDFKLRREAVAEMESISHDEYEELRVQRRTTSPQQSLIPGA